MENFGTALVGGLSGLQGTLSGSTGSAATGNVNMGNVAMDQMQLAPNRTSAFMSSLQNDLSGNTFSSNALTGRTAASLLRNQGFASRVVSMRVSEQDVTEASRQADAARSEVVSAGQQRSAVLTEAFTRGLAKIRSTRSSSGSTSSSFEQLGETMNRLDQITRGVSDSTGLSQSQVASIAFGAVAHLGLSAPSISPVSAGASLKADAGKSYQTGLSADQRKVLGAMTSEQIAEFKQFGDRVSRDTSFSNVVGSDSREGRELASRLATTASRSERADASYAERTALAERLSSAREHGEVLSIDIAQDPHNLEMFMRYAERYGGSSAAAAAMFDAEIARQGLRPTRTFSDGSALPASFNDLHRRHEHDNLEPALNPDISAAGREHGHQVARFGNTVPVAEASPPVSPLRSEIQTRAAGIRQQAEAASGSFDAKAEIAPTQDGTLASKKSLLKQTAKQVGSDASASIDVAKDAVKGLLKKKH